MVLMEGMFTLTEKHFHPMKYLNGPLKIETYHDANFVITGCTGGCHNDNLQWFQWWQRWHHDYSLALLDKYGSTFKGFVGPDLDMLRGINASIDDASIHMLRRLMLSLIC